MPGAHIGHDENVVGAFGLVLGDRLRMATEEACGLGGAMPAALVSLHEWAGGRPIEVLATALRVSHSRAVRVVDRLEDEGLARRAPDPADARVALVSLTAAGRRRAEQVLAARAEALTGCLADLDAVEREQLAALAAKVLGVTTTGRIAARMTCRLCDADACGHHDGRCPVSHAADAAEAPR
jgi:DNA-binding MarR family transcriptional regulator